MSSIYPPEDSPFMTSLIHSSNVDPNPFLPYKNTLKKSFFKRKAHWNDLPDRKIVTNLPDFEIGGNEIHTSKYNLLTFLPKNLIEQFSKLANFYFLIIGRIL